MTNDTTSDQPKARVLSGMRPTGRLHIGHYFGALSNWVRMQDEYDSYHFVADWHALTTHYADSSQVATNTLEVATDWLAVGLDPRKVTLFIQSSVPEHAELHLLLSMITPLSWLERVPTYKEQIENLRDKDLGTYGFLGYPLLQSADIVMYGEPGQKLLVPVGEDQAPHIEMTREVVRRCNTTFGFDVSDDLFKHDNWNDLNYVLSVAPPPFRALAPAGLIAPEDFKAFFAPDDPEVVKQDTRHFLRKTAAEWGYRNFTQRMGKASRHFSQREILQEPDVILTETPRVPGTDGRRMAKSYGNAIWLSDTPEEVRAKTRNMMTDPQRVKRTDPGRPEICPVFAYHNLFPEKKSDEDCARLERVDRECRTAAIGCVDCKRLMADALVKWIEPIQARRAKYEANPREVWDVLEEGSQRAKKIAEATMERVRKAVFNWEGAGRVGWASDEAKAAADRSTRV